METQLKEKIRSIIRENFIKELSKNDVHVKEIMKFYDKGTYSTKKAVSIFVSGKPNATRNQILDDLGDMGYNDAWEVMDHFKLTLESVTEGDIVPGASVNEKSDDVFADYSSSKGKTKGRSFSVNRAVKDGKYSFESDDNDGTVRLLYNGKLISYGFNDWSTGGFVMIHSSWKNNDKPFKSVKDIIKYFKSKRITTEADVVPGGLAKGLSLNDIAEKHGVSVDMMVAEFKKGIQVEMEHTTDREVAKEITLDHLFEDPKYYDKLAKVEEYIDDKGVERVGAALPQTEEEPVNEVKLNDLVNTRLSIEVGSGKTTGNWSNEELIEKLKEAIKHNLFDREFYYNWTDLGKEYNSIFEKETLSPMIKNIDRTLKEFFVLKGSTLVFRLEGSNAQKWIDKWFQTKKSISNELKSDYYSYRKKYAGVTLREYVNEEKVYIDFLNKAKGFKQDRIKFNSYEAAVKWAKKNFDKFSPDMIKYESVNESTNPSDIIKDLDKAKNDLLKKVDVLIAKKKKLYSNVDIESPMSADEKKLDKDIADLFSQINTLVLQKRKAKNNQ